MAKRKVQYHEGDWFAVPLKGGGYAVGVVARHDGQGLLLGYFFGPRWAKVPRGEQVTGQSASEAVWMCLCNDIQLANATWPLIGHATAWDRTQWPVPVFARVDEFDGSAVRVVYSDALKLAQETPAEVDKVRHLPEHIFRGYGSVEDNLSRLLPA
jgi:hypothetical protein